MWRYLPDVDPTTPQVYVDMQNMIPTPWGTYRTNPSPVEANSATVNTPNNTDQQPTGSAFLVKADGTTRWYWGNVTHLYESTSSDTAWTNVRSGAYTSSATGWQFAQFGNVTIATNKSDAVQSVNGAAGTAFAALAGTPPKAAIVVVQSNVVMLMNYNGGTDTPDGWFGSDVGDHTQWTPGASNDSANGRLLATPGAITAGIAFGGSIIAFKETSVYRGTYVGKPFVWQWELLHPAIGTSSPNGVATDGKTLFFFGKNGAYIYDGAQFTRVDDGIEKTLQNSVTHATCRVVWSDKEQIFVIHLAAGSETYGSYCPRTGAWGVGSTFVAASIRYVIPVNMPPGYLRRLVSTTIGAGPAYLTTGHTLSGTAYNGGKQSYVKTGWIGSDREMTYVSNVIPLYVPDDDYSYDSGTVYANITHKTAYVRGGTMGNSTTSNINTTTGRFDIQKSARWHEFKIDDGSTPFNGGMELSGLDIVSKSGGTF